MEYLAKARAQQFLKLLASGAFPMADDRFAREVYIVAPKTRAVIPLRMLHLSRKLAKIVQRDIFEVCINYDFDRIIHCCAARQPTWINQQIIEAYLGLHRLGYAHSVECWQEGKLAGGLYGVALGGAFFGESMFSHKRDASKVALVHLVARLCAGGFTLLDAQFITSHLRQFGAIEISSERFKERLKIAKKIDANFYALPDKISGQRSLQAIGHKS